MCFHDSLSLPQACLIVSVVIFSEPVYGYPKDRFSAGSRAWMESRGAFPHGVSPEDWYYSSWDGYVGTGSGMYRDRDRERGWDRGYDDHLSHGGSYSHGYNQYPTRVPPPRHLPPPTLSRGITTGSVGYGGDVDSRGGRGDIYRSDPGSSLYYPESKAGYYAEGHYRDSTFSSRTGDLSHEKGCNNGQYSRDSRERSTSSERRPSGGNKSNPPVPAQPKPPSQPQPPTTPTASSSNPFNSSVKNSPPLRSSPSFTKSLLGDRQKQESTVHKEKVALTGPFKRSMTESLLHDKELSALKRSFDTAVPSGKGKKDLDASVIEAMLDVAKSKSYKKNVAKADSSDTVEKIPLASSSSSLKQRTVVLPPQPPQYGSISVDKREFDGKKEKVDLSLAEKLSMICSSNKSGSFSIDDMRHQQTIANSIPSLFGKKDESELSKEKAKTESADSKSTSGLSLENPKKRVAWGQGTSDTFHIMLQCCNSS